MGLADHLGFAALASLTDLTVLVGLASTASVVHCCRSQAGYSPITVKNFVTVYTIKVQLR